MLLEVPHNSKTFQCNTQIDQTNYFKFVMTITDNRVFQISFKENRESPTSMGNNGNFPGGEIFYWVVKIYSKVEWFWIFQPFLNLEPTFYKFWMSIKIKISTACVYKECEVKMKMVQKQWLKIKFSLSCNMKIVI